MERRPKIVKLISTGNSLTFHIKLALETKTRSSFPSTWLVNDNVEHLCSRADVGTQLGADASLAASPAQCTVVDPRMVLSRVLSL